MGMELTRIVISSEGTTAGREAQTLRTVVDDRMIIVIGRGEPTVTDPPSLELHTYPFPRRSGAVDS